MRNLDGTLDGNLNDNLSAKTSGSVTFVQTSSINENLTQYDLLPVVVNRPPIIVTPVWEASRPQIKSANTANATGNNLYKFEDGNVKVYIGSTFTLKVQAIQPDTYNVENGIPTIKAPNQDLYYLWRQDDAIVRTFDTPSLQSAVIVSGSSLRFERIQPSSAGTYVCEISNDIGSVFSEPITIEVYNPDLDAYFYRNLVQNGNATSDTSNWTANNSDFTRRDLYRGLTVDLKRPNRVDLFGYTIDMMHPRPYQIEPGIIKNVNYEASFFTPLGQQDGGYFTRTPYKFEKAGGSFFVKAYQDIDVTEIQDFIRGSIYGIDGVRAVFGCYIGNAILNWIPTRELVLPDSKIDSEKYFLGAPRVSLENFLMAGPGKPIDEVYVTLEEYDNETRLASTVLNEDKSKTTLPRSITLKDPWAKRMPNYYQKKYYEQDKYKLNTTSKGDWVDAVLFTADELYPDPNDRPNHGQYMEFNRVVLERLNPKTTKIRITLNFWTNDWKIWQHLDYDTTGVDRTFELLGWEKNYRKNTFDQVGSSTEVDFIRSIIDKDPKYKDKDYVERWGLCPPPRAAVTGISLALIPIERSNQRSTERYTSTALSLNNKPKTNVPSALVSALKFDPFGLLKRTLLVKFKNTQSLLKYEGGTLVQNHTLEIILKDRKEGTAEPFEKVSNTSGSLFPFVKDSPGYAFAENLTEFTTAMEGVTTQFTELQKGLQTNADFKLGSTKRKNVQDQLKSIEPMFTAFTNFVPTKIKRKTATWDDAFRYILYFQVIPPQGSSGSVPPIVTNSYYLKVAPNTERPVILYRDAGLPKGTGENAFEVKDWQVNLNGTMTIELPKELLTATLNDGGLGIPLGKNQNVKLLPIDALQILKNQKKPISTPEIGRIFDNWYERQVANQPQAQSLNISTSAAQLQTNSETNAERAEYLNSFTIDVQSYFSDKQNLNQLALKWSLAEVKPITMQVQQEMPNPNYIVCLYAVRTAPQFGPKLNGSPIFGYGLNGEQYSVVYDTIEDTYTTLLS